MYWERQCTAPMSYCMLGPAMHQKVCHLALAEARMHFLHCIMLAKSEMFHPPNIPQRQRNSNETGFQWVPVENLLNADVAPVADPFFQPLLAVVGRC